jgi:ATP-dependent exoDNAse (exonuclease V) alpha subunit
VRGGDATNYITEKKNHAQLQVFAGQPDRVSAGEHAAVSAWRERQAGRPWGHAVLIARDNNRRERLNALTRTELQRDGRLGASVHIGGCEFAVGDRVVARRNDRERAVNNGMRGTVIAVDPAEKEVLVRTDGGVQLRLDAPYSPSISSTPTC